VDPQTFPHWRAFINLCLALLISLILLEFIFPEALGHYVGAENLEVIELLLSLVILTDLAISFVKAEDKKTFLKKNFIKIIAVFPWGVAFRGLALLRIEAQFPFLAEFLAIESEGMVAQKVASGAGKGIRLFTKITELLDRL
jgi:hypothetical protein